MGVSSDVLAVIAFASVWGKDWLQRMLIKTLSSLTRVGFRLLLDQVKHLFGMSISTNSSELIHSFKFSMPV